VNDQRGRPSSAEQLARTSLDLLGGGARGAYHACDGGECTWFEFARAAVAELGIECVVEPCTSAEFPSPAARPGYSVLDLSTTVARIGPLVSWRDSLRDVLARLED
jgi:dTDP-4-dehydrorhamnose reductase